MQAQGTAAAKKVGLLEQEIKDTVGKLLRLPVIQVADKELEAARWFHKDWLCSFLAGGTLTAHLYPDHCTCALMIVNANGLGAKAGVVLGRVSHGCM